jgi:predicted  nucleic acid-binding Zn-ribbon protein
MSHGKIALMNEEKTTLESINNLLLEITDARQKMKTVKDQLKDVMEQNDEYRALAEELKEATAKRQTAKKLLEADKDYQLVNSELEEMKFKYKDLQEILSHHLVTYFQDTRETSIPLANGSALQVVVSAKLGKEVAG